MAWLMNAHSSVRGMACHPADTICQNKWDSLQLKSKGWTGLDTWQIWWCSRHDFMGKWASWLFLCKCCYIVVSSSVQLQKAQQRKQKERWHCSVSSQPSTSDTCEEPPPPKRLRSSVGGPLYDKTKCVCSMKDEDKKHPNRLNAPVSI